MKHLLPIALSLSVLASGSVAFACLHGPESYAGSLAQSAQEAIVFWNKGREELVVRLRYELSSGDSVGTLAWVVPVPAAPDAYGTVDPRVFADLHDTWEHDQDLRRDASGRVVWRKPQDYGGITFSDGGEEDVELLTQVSVGAYDVQPIRAKGAAGAKAVNGWLSKNGFGTVPLANMQHYVDRGWVWLAVKINPARAGGTIGKEGTLRPLRISFKSERIVYPLKFSTHQGEFGVRLWVVTNGALSDDERTLTERYPTPDGDLELEATQRWLPLPASVDAVQTGATGFSALDNRVGVKVPRVTRVSFSIKGEAIALWNQDFSLAPPLPAPERLGAAPFAPRGLDPATETRRAQAKAESHGGGLSFGDDGGAGAALLALDEIPAQLERPRDLFARAKILAGQGAHEAAEKLVAEALRRAPDGAPSAARFRLERLLERGQVTGALALIDRLARRDRYARNRFARSLVQILTRLGRYAEAYERVDATRGRVVRKGKVIQRYAPSWTQTALQALVRDEAAGIVGVARAAAAATGQKRREALQLLGWLGPRAAAHLPLVLGAVSAKSEPYRLAAAVAADRIAPNDPRVFEHVWTAFAAIEDAQEWEDDSLQTETTLALLLAKFPTPALARLRARWERPKGKTFLAATALARLGEPAAPLLRAALQGSDPNAAREILSALGRFPPAAARLVPDLTRVVEGSHPGLQAKAAAALARVGAAAAPALPALLRALQSSDAEVRLRASITLGRIPSAAPSLIELLGKPALAAAASRALIRVGAPAVAALEAALPKARHNGWVVWTLGQIGPAAVPTLIKAARDPDATLQATALWAIADLGLAAAPAQSLALELLSGTDDGVRELAASVLGQLPNSAPHVAKTLNDTRASVRAAALTALRLQGVPEGGVVNTRLYMKLLLSKLGDPAPRVRRHAAQALVASGQHALHPHLRRQLTNKFVRRSCLEVLGQIPKGDLDEVWVKSILHAVGRDKRPEVRRAALRALTHHEAYFEAWEPAAAALLREDTDGSVRLAAIRALTDRERSLAAASCAAIAAALGDKDVAVRRVAARRVGNTDVENVALALLPLLTDADREVRRIAATQVGECVGDHGGVVEPALLKLLGAAKQPDMQLAALKGLSGVSWSPAGTAAVVRLLGSPSVVLRRTAAEALAYGVKAKDAKHAPTLIACLTDVDVGVRVALVKCLASLGPKAEGVEAALERASKDDHRRVRRVAHEALARLRKR